MYKSKAVFKATKQFQAGHGSVEFLKGENSEWVSVVLKRKTHEGSMVEVSRESVPADMQPRLVARMKPF